MVTLSYHTVLVLASFLAGNLPFVQGLPTELESRTDPAAASDAQPALADPGAPDCANIGDFTLQKFQDNMIKQPDRDTCLFYTRRTNGETQSLSTTARNYAHNNGLSTIWDLWPGDEGSDVSWYNMQGKNSWLRCIHAHPDQEQAYFSAMSNAFALACKGDVQVMSDDPAQLPADGIWYYTELPALNNQRADADKGKITAIDITGSNPTDVQPYKKRSLTKRADGDWTVNPWEPAGEDWFA